MTAKSKTSRNSDSSEDDFEAFLAHYNYNSSEPLSTELISYFDMKLNPAAVCSMHDLTQHHGSLPVGLEETQRLALSLDDLDHYPLADGEPAPEGDVTRPRELKDPRACREREQQEEEDALFFNQDEVLEMLRTAAESAASGSSSHRRLANDRLHSCLHAEDDTAPPSLLCVTGKLNAAGGPLTHLDSDEGSISSGCETSSTVTTNTDDSVATATSSSTVGNASSVLSKPGSVLERVRSFEQLAENQVIHVPLGERADNHSPASTVSGSSATGPHPDAMIFKRSITFPAPGVKSSFLMPMSMPGSHSTGPMEPIDSPLDSLNEIVEPHRTEGEQTTHLGHHLHNNHHRHRNHLRGEESVEGSKPKVRQMRLKSTVAAVNTQLINNLQAIDSDSEFSDESGYVEFQDNQPSIKSVTA